MGDLSSIKEKLQLVLKKKEIEAEKNRLIDYSKVLKGTLKDTFEDVLQDILDKLDQIEKKKIDNKSDEIIAELRTIAELLVGIKIKEIEFPEYPEVKTGDIIASVKKLQNSLEEKEREKKSFWSKTIAFLKKQIDLDEFFLRLGELLGSISVKIFKVRIEEQKETIRVMSVDGKGNLVKGDVSVMVPNLGILKDVTGEMINPATKEKQDAIITAIGIGGGIAGTPIIYNVAMTLAGTEYSKALPSSTKKVDIKLRATNSQLKIAFVSGESGTNYINIPYGSSLHLENVNLTGVIVYVQSPVALQICEILCFT